MRPVDQRPIEAAIVDEVAKEFQLDEVDLIPPAGTPGIAGDVYDPETFLQNLDEVVRGFRTDRSSKTSNPHRE